MLFFAVVSRSGVYSPDDIKPADITTLATSYSSWFRFTHVPLSKCFHMLYWTELSIVIDSCRL